MRTACRELQGCASFSKLLQAVLELGNHLNQVGTCRGSSTCYVLACGEGGRLWDGAPPLQRQCRMVPPSSPATCMLRRNCGQLRTRLPPPRLSWPPVYCVQGTQRGAAAGFKLDTLLKLADVKGTDRKTSLLHFVITQAGLGGRLH